MSFLAILEGRVTWKLLEFFTGTCTGRRAWVLKRSSVWKRHKENQWLEAEGNKSNLKN